MITTTIEIPQRHPDPKTPPPAPNANLMTSFLFVSNGLKFSIGFITNNRLCARRRIWYNLEIAIKNFFWKIIFVYLKKFKKKDAQSVLGS